MAHGQGGVSSLHLAMVLEAFQSHAGHSSRRAWYPILVQCSVHVHSIPASSQVPIYLITTPSKLYLQRRLQWTHSNGC